MKRRNKYPAIFYLLLILLILAGGCGPSRVYRTMNAPGSSGEISPKASYLKIHMKDGTLYVLDEWAVQERPDTIIGKGVHFDQNRKPLEGQLESRYHTYPPGRSSFVIPHDEIVFLETNSLEGFGGNLAAQTIIGVPIGIISVYCAINPKACFGSCPTFYADNGSQEFLMAEGFSSSILPAFEKGDIDMLYWAVPHGPDFEVRLTNEALETHVIRHVDLLVFRIQDDERVFATPEGDYYRASGIIEPVVCNGPEGDIRDLVREMDHKERFSPASEKSLAKKESIEMEFITEPGKDYGLVLGNRQTLLTTWLFYQSLAYTGTRAGELASGIERGRKGITRKVNRIWDILGGIEVYIMDGGRWKPIGQVDEMGPIAADVHVLPLPPTDKQSVRIKLVMTQGLWRLDYAGLAQISGNPVPERIRPGLVRRGDTIREDVRQILLDSVTPLVTFPGDQYTISYMIPDQGRLEIFLDTKGYYLEWMREEWLAEEDLVKAAVMFAFPRYYLRKASRGFKEAEPFMEEKFWGSRYVNFE